MFSDREKFTERYKWALLGVRLNRKQVKKNATSGIFENKQVGNRLLKGSGGKNIENGR